MDTDLGAAEAAEHDEADLVLKQVGRVHFFLGRERGAFNIGKVQRELRGPPAVPVSSLSRCADTTHSLPGWRETYIFADEGFRSEVCFSAFMPQ